MTRSRQNGFTLIELLVVVAIIALLISIVLPAFSHFKKVSKRTVCMANLHSISQLLEAYMNESGDHYPVACSMISVETDPNKQAISDVLLAGVSTNSRKVFHCPADRIMEDPNHFNETYFDRERTSYEWDFTGFYGGTKRDRDYTIDIEPNAPPIRISPSDAPIMNDWECFHATFEENKSICVMFADLSVRADDYELSRDEWPLANAVKIP
ncbi:MAG: type II secretion system protein [Phycisphaerae bacterium]|nr:type II secretion system protein [Phycisphaerae bacterium]